MQLYLDRCLDALGTAIAPAAIDEKTSALKNRQTRLLIGLGLPRRVTGTHHDTGNDVGGGLPGLAVHIGQRDALLPWHLSGICKIGRTVEAD